MWCTVPAPCRPRCSGGGVVAVEPAPRVAAHLPAGLEAEADQQLVAPLGLRRVRARTGEAAQTVLLRDVGRVRDQRRLARVVDDQLELQPFRILEDERAARDNASDPLAPELERLLGADAERDQMHHPVAGPASRRAGVLEERDVCARRAALIGVEEVVDGRVVLVDGLLDHPQAELPA